MSDRLLDAGPGLLLLTGESGSGKTWLWRRLLEQLPSGWCCQAVEMTEALEPLEFLALLGRGLVGTPSERLGATRLALLAALGDEARDGRSWLLVLENAHLASLAVRSELLALIHGMEAGDGFAGILVLGPTALARQLAGREWTALASRLTSHLHLLPLDVDECRELAGRYCGPNAPDQATLERMHRDCGGNPRRLVQGFRRRSGLAGVRVAGSATAAARLPEPSTPLGATSFPTAALAAATAIQPRQVAPAPGPPELLPARPPLRVEEGLVEVGWEGSLEADGSPASESANAPLPIAAEHSQIQPAGEETIEDHYAALQAWNEWARNRGRPTEPTPTGSGAARGAERPEFSLPPGDEDAGRASGVRSISGIRAEPQHEHAPYSPLFSRLRQSS
jgi:general secretion pathway protein A